MYDVEKLVSIVCDYLDAEADYMKYSLDARKELGLAPNIQELREKYAPKVRGIVSGEEAKAIYEVLEIDKRNNIELQNIRDMVVMIYGQWFDKSRDQYLEDKKNGVQAVDKSAEYLDAMSAIICVIDYEKFKRGIGV